MREYKFENGILSLQLEAQMPLIHFQSGQCGVTLRATEAKPKLDRFIIGALMRESGLTLAELKKDSTYKRFFKDGKSHDALDYKMQITVEAPPRLVEVGVNANKKREISASYSMYYGNMGEKTEKKYGVFSNPTVTIICLKEDLRKVIEKNIAKFFLTTNFGTMQNKGFGGFAPADFGASGVLTEDEKKAVAKYYGEIIPNCHCYALPFEAAEPAEMSEAIKTFYSIMKSGFNRGVGNYARSYIYQYMHEKYQIGNEKSWMKQQEIAPAISGPDTPKPNAQEEKHPQYYVRAFLGTGEKIEFGSGYDDRGFISFKKKVKMHSNKFERVSSPIYFKVIKNIVFIVGFDVPEALYGESFEFHGEWKGNDGKLSVPTKEALGGKKFDMQDFLDSYARYFNGDLRRQARIGRIPKVVRVYE